MSAPPGPTPGEPGYAEWAAASRVPQILIGTVTPFVLVTIVVFGRLYSRAVITHSWGHDDTWMSISWILGFGLMILNVLFVKYGSGHHASTLTLSDVIVTLKLAFTARILYPLAIGTTKISICYFNLRIFRDKTAKRLSYGIIILVVIYTFAFFMISLLGCVPPSGQWSLAPTGACTGATGRLVVVYGSGALNIIIDIVLLGFIIPRVLALQMHFRQKVVLLISLSISVIVIIASVLRMVETAETGNTTDQTWTSLNVQVWTAVEVASGLFCASAPALKPLLRKMTPSLFSSLTGGSSSYGRRGTYGHGSRYATDHTASRRVGGKHADHMELQSRTDLDDIGKHKEPGHAQLTNTVWRGDKGDSESERRVLDAPEELGKIRKTVSVTVVDVKADPVDEHDVDGSSGSSMRKFEHV